MTESYRLISPLVLVGLVSIGAHGAVPAGADNTLTMAAPTVPVVADDAADPLALRLAHDLGASESNSAADAAATQLTPVLSDMLAVQINQGVAAREAGDYALARQRFTGVLASDPERSDVLELLAITEAYDKHYDLALAHLDTAQALAPEDLDLVLDRARILSWSGQLAEASTLVDGVLSAAPDNADAWDLRARIHWYQSHPVEAEMAERRAIAIDPENTDYQLLLAQTLAAQSRTVEAVAMARELQPLRPGDAAVAELLQDAAQPVPDAEPAPLPWRLDFSLSHSTFERVPLQNWDGVTLQLNRTLSSTDTVYGRVENAHRFGLAETALTVGDAHEFQEGFGAYGEVTVTPASAFFPAWRVAGGLERQIRPPDAWPGATALLLDGGFSHYLSGNVVSLVPGISQYLAGGRGWITVQLENTLGGSGSYLNGWAVRADALLTPVWNVHSGWSKGPQAESALNGSLISTVRTFSAGTSWDVSRTLLLRLDYLREDWARSYIRNELMLGGSFRF